ncbi:MAG TPA: galactokinase [Gemmatimonadota bacterium]|nr:galactokinase [Gemmatimonadota bacterium]
MSTINPSGHDSQTEIASAAFKTAFGEKAEWVCRAPGRVNLIGEHVDYNDGLVLPVALELEVAVAFRSRDDRLVRINSADFDETIEFDIDDLAPGSVSGWAAYPAGVAWTLAHAGLPPGGLDATVAASVPVGAGLSSSAALEIAFAAAFRQVAAFDIPNLELARLGQAAENHFVGVRCGIMDQVAAACAIAGHAILLDCRSLEIVHVPLPAGLRIVVVDTGVKRELSVSGYNQRRRECEEAVARLAAVDDDIQALRDVPPDHLEATLQRLPPPLDRRTRHVVGEIERVRLAAAALQQNESQRVGELLFASHRSLREDYEVSCEELDSLVELARQAPGVLGARLTGAGFGGCTVNIVSAALLEDFLAHVSEGYERLYGRAPDAYVSQPAAGVSLDRTW